MSVPNETAMASGAATTPRACYVVVPLGAANANGFVTICPNDVLTVAALISSLGLAGGTVVKSCNVRRASDRHFVGPRDSELSFLDGFEGNDDERSRRQIAALQAENERLSRRAPGRALVSAVRWPILKPGNRRRGLTSAQPMGSMARTIIDADAKARRPMGEDYKRWPRNLNS